MNYDLGKKLLVPTTDNTFGGITLREHYAGLAMSALIQGKHVNDLDYEKVAAEAANFADWLISHLQNSEIEDPAPPSDVFSSAAINDADIPF